MQDNDHQNGTGNYKKSGDTAKANADPGTPFGSSLVYSYLLFLTNDSVRNDSKVEILRFAHFWHIHFCCVPFDLSYFPRIGHTSSEFRFRIYFFLSEATK